MSKRRCETCRFTGKFVTVHLFDTSQPLVFPALICRHGPPPPVAADGHPGDWPLRYRTDWCYQWEPREEEPPG